MCWRSSYPTSAGSRRPREVCKRTQPQISMTSTPKTQNEIIQETLDAYSKPGTRAVEHGLCRYRTSDGRECAVGRCLKNSKSFSHKSGSVGTVFRDEANLDAAPKPEYRGHSISFWSLLQTLHDVYLAPNVVGSPEVNTWLAKRFPFFTP